MNPPAKKYTTYFLFILIFSFFVIVLWIATNIYSKFVSSTIDETLSNQTTPIKPSFDEKTINNLKTRRSVTPLNKLDAVATDVSPTPSATPDPDQLDTESSISPTPTLATSPIPSGNPVTTTTPSPNPTDNPGGAI